uniref:IgLON family member 5 n=1 Tax=Varanus komodoensis TaxID=61221 RepID=A0A8D2JIC7_VARKO
MLLLLRERKFQSRTGQSDSISHLQTPTAQYSTTARPPLSHLPSPSPHNHTPFSPLLPCYINQEVTRVAWLNRSNILYAGNDKWSIDPRVQLVTYIPSKFSIMITHVDVYDEGLYTCSFQTQDKPHTSQVYLIVQVPARIVNISSSVTVNEGSNVNLLCLAVGKPEPTVIWRQMKGKGDGFTSEGEYLEITDINRQQAGEYECITENGVLVPDRKHVLITVNYPPTITDVKDSHPPIGKMALLRCEAMAVPPAEFQWFKDDKHRLIGGSDGMQIQNERTRSILLFTNVTARHYGNYTCLASNHLGSFNVSLRLISESLHGDYWGCVLTLSRPLHGPHCANKP